MASGTFATASALRRAIGGQLSTATGPVTEAVVTALDSAVFDWCATETRPDDGATILQPEFQDLDGSWIYRLSQGRWVRRYAQAFDGVGEQQTIAVADTAAATQATEAQTATRRVRLTGTLTADRAVVLVARAVGAEWLVENACNFDVAVSCGSSSSVTVPAGDTMIVSLGE